MIYTHKLKLAIIKAERNYFNKKGIVNPTPAEILMMRKAINNRKNIKELMKDLENKHKKITSGTL